MRERRQPSEYWRTNATCRYSSTRAAVRRYSSLTPSHSSSTTATHCKEHRELIAVALTPPLCYPVALHRSHITTLIARRGFIRLALEQGCDLVPTMVFREKYMYNVYPPPRAVVRFFLRLFKTPVLLFAGRFFTWLPFHTYLSIAFDRPIQVQRVDRPSDEQVEALWMQFRERTEGLWEKYKTTYGYGEDERLEIRDAAGDAEEQASHSGSSSSSSSSTSGIGSDRRSGRTKRE